MLVDKKSDVRLTVVLNRDLRRKFLELCFQEKKTMREKVIEMVKKYVTEHKST